MASSRWNKHATLICVWAGLQLLYLASGILCFVSAFAWRGLGPIQNVDGPSLIRRFATTATQTLVVIILGSLILLNVVASGALHLLARGKPSIRLLTMSTALLGFMIIVTLLAGSYIWFCSLRQVTSYAVAFGKLDSVVQGYIQNRLQCCGYYNATNEGLFTSSEGYCSSTTGMAEARGCSTPITAFSDRVLNTVFTAMYGIVAVQCLLFLATACLKVDRIEEERFNSIEKKRGLAGGLV